MNGYIYMKCHLRYTSSLSNFHLTHFLCENTNHYVGWSVGNYYDRIIVSFKDKFTESQQKCL
jgi:hypothetical protein